MRLEIRSAGSLQFTGLISGCVGNVCGYRSDTLLIYSYSLKKKKERKVWMNMSLNPSVRYRTTYYSFRGSGNVSGGNVRAHPED